MTATAITTDQRYIAHRIPNETVASWLAVIMALAALGPYVAGPVRTEQIAVYGIGALVLPAVWVRLRPSAGIGILIAWSVLLGVALYGVLLPLREPQPHEAGSVLAGIDNLALPLVIMALVWSGVRSDVAPAVFARFARIVVWGTAINGLVTVASTRLPLEPYLRPFWTASSVEGLTTAELASQLGRESGIFNQPAEAGVLYGVAGMLALYQYPERSRPLFLALGAIVAGGILTVSKVFLLGGLPLILILLFWHAGRRRLIHLALAGIAGYGLIQSGLFSQWRGSAYLLRRLIPSQDMDLLEFYSAGRWSQDASMVETIRDALNTSPLTGVGAGGWKVPYDSAWTESIIVAGLFGAGCYAVVLILFGLIGLREADPRRRLLMVSLAVLLAGASFGISPLTANRVATVVWVTIALLVRAHQRAPQRPAM